MKLQQLRYAREIARHNLSISDAAHALHTSQPGVSKQIRLLEDELGVEIFVRKRNRVVEIPAVGQAMLAVAHRLLDDADILKRLGRDFASEESGSLTVVTTHTQARYTLPGVIKRFLERYPAVRLNVRQGTPNQMWQLVENGEADIALASEPSTVHPQLLMLKCYDLQRVVLMPPRHALLKNRRLTLAALAKYPIITYDQNFIGYSKLQRAFESSGLTPNLMLSASDTDVIKTYVELGLGIAIVADMAFDAKRDRNLRAIPAGHLFDANTVYLGFRRNSYLRRYAFDFIEMLVPHLTRKVVQGAIDASSASAPPVYPARANARRRGGQTIAKTAK